nr:AzlD domain-containing protein [Mitsuokella sp. oral taxon 131]
MGQSRSSFPPWLPSSLLSPCFGSGWIRQPRDRKTPPYIRYLGRMLPASVFSLLVVYCLRHVDIASGSHGLPEWIAVAATILLHRVRRQMLLSIGGGTLLYMLLVQTLFS